MTEDEILETERTGGFYEYQCPCGFEDCDCLQRHEYDKEEQLRDDKLFKEK